MISSGSYFAAALLLICLINDSLANERNYDGNGVAASTPNNARPLANSYRRQGAWTHTTTAPPPTRTSENACEYKILMTGLHDRINKLATLDEDLRNRLDKIEHKLGQFEAANLANAESLDEKSMSLQQHLTKIETVQQQFRQELHDFKINDLDPLARSARQIDLGNYNVSDTVNDSQKLDAMATLLVSNAEKIKSLEEQLNANITRLLTATNTLLTRVERLRRTQLKSNRGNIVALGAAGSDSEDLPVTNCNQGLLTTSGILKLNLPNQPMFYVLCEETFNNGGWTVIQNRHYGDVSFQRDWSEYKTGFGNLAGDFFLGLEKIHALTTHTLHELAILLEDHANITHIARYNLFAIGNEQEAYNLKLLGTYSGDAGDAFTYHAGSKFSTFDNDNDGCVECNCAAAHLGGWWYNWCDMSNLNGKYYTTNFDNVPTYTGVYWHHFQGPNYSLRSVRMMIRPLATEDVRR